MAYELWENSFYSLSFAPNIRVSCSSLGKYFPYISTLKRDKKARALLILLQSKMFRSNNSALCVLGKQWQHVGNLVGGAR